MNEIISSSVLLSIIRVIGISIQAGTILYLTHSLNINDMGYFSLVYSFLGIIRFLGPLGTDKLVMRQISKEKNVGYSIQASKISISSITLTFILSIIISTIIFLLLKFSNYANFSIIEIWTIIFSIPAFSMTGVFIGQIRGYDYNISAQIPEAIGFHFLFAIQIFLFEFLALLNRQVVLISICIASWGVIFIYAIIRYRIGVDWSCLPNKKEILGIMKGGIGIFQALALTALSTRVPIFLTTAIIGPTGTAIMDIAIRFGSLSSIFTTSVAATFSPVFASLSHNSNQKIRLKKLKLASTTASIPAILWLSIVALGGQYATLNILPNTYENSYIPIVFVCIAITINASFGISSNYLIMGGEEKLVQNFSLLQLIVLCISGYFLASYFNIAGIAAAMILGHIARDCGMIAYIIKTRK